MGHGEQIYGAIYVKRLVLLDLELPFVSLSFQLLHSTKRKRLNPIGGSIGMKSTAFSCRGSLI